MRIGELAREASVGVETVRFYERKGFIDQPLKPADGGFRSYTKDDVERIRFVRQAQTLGFSLKEIQELLSLGADPDGDCAAVREQAEKKREDVDAKMAQLMNIRASLDQLIEACPGKGATEFCTILGAFSTGEPQAQIVKPSPDKPAPNETTRRCCDDKETQS